MGVMRSKWAPGKAGLVSLSIREILMQQRKRYRMCGATEAKRTPLLASTRTHPEPDLKGGMRLRRVLHQMLLLQPLPMRAMPLLVPDQKGGMPPQKASHPILLLPQM